MILKSGYDFVKISHQERSTQGYRPDRLWGLVRVTGTLRLSSNLLSLDHALHLVGHVHYLLLKPVFLHLILHMLASEYHAKVPLSRRLLHTFRSLRRIHFLDDFNGMQRDFIIKVLFLRGQLAHKLVGILIGTLSPELPVKVVKVGLKLLLAFYHRLLVKLLDICEGADPGVKLIQIVLDHRHLCDLLLDRSHAPPATLHPVLEESGGLALGVVHAVVGGHA